MTAAAMQAPRAASDGAVPPAVRVAAEAVRDAVLARAPLVLLTAGASQGRAEALALSASALGTAGLAVVHVTDAAALDAAVLAGRLATLRSRPGAARGERVLLVEDAEALPPGTAAMLSALLDLDEGGGRALQVVLAGGTHLPDWLAAVAPGLAGRAGTPVTLRPPPPVVARADSWPGGGARLPAARRGGRAGAVGTAAALGFAGGLAAMAAGVWLLRPPTPGVRDAPVVAVPWAAALPQAPAAPPPAPAALSPVPAAATPPTAAPSAAPGRDPGQSAAAPAPPVHQPAPPTQQGAAAAFASNDAPPPPAAAAAPPPAAPPAWWLHLPPAVPQDHALVAEMADAARAVSLDRGADAGPGTPSPAPPVPSQQAPVPSQQTVALPPLPVPAAPPPAPPGAIVPAPVEAATPEPRDVPPRPPATREASLPPLREEGARPARPPLVSHQVPPGGEDVEAMLLHNLGRADPGTRAAFATLNPSWAGAARLPGGAVVLLPLRGSGRPPRFRRPSPEPVVVAPGTPRPYFCAHALPQNPGEAAYIRQACGS